MFAILHAVGKCVADLFKSWSLLEAWNLFLRHQLAIALRRARPCLRHHGSDRAAARMDDQTMAEPAWCRPGGSAEDFTLGLCNDYHRETFGVTALCPGLVRTLMLEDVARIRNPQAATSAAGYPTLNTGGSRGRGAHSHPPQPRARGYRLVRENNVVAYAAEPHLRQLAQPRWMAPSRKNHSVKSQSLKNAE